MTEWFLSLFEGKSTLFIIGQILGFVIMVENLFIFFQQSRDRVLVFKFISDVLSVTQYALCGAYSGMAVQGVALGREVVFYNRGKKKWASRIWWLYFFLVLTCAAPFITSAIAGVKVFSPMWFYNFLPAVGSAFAVIGFYSENVAITRLFNFIAASLWLVYDIITVNYIATINAIINLVSVLVGTIISIVRAHKAKKSAASENATAPEAAEEGAEATTEEGDDIVDETELPSAHDKDDATEEVSADPQV